MLIITGFITRLQRNLAFPDTSIITTLALTLKHIAPIWLKVEGEGHCIRELSFRKEAQPYSTNRDGARDEENEGQFTCDNSVQDRRVLK